LTAVLLFFRYGQPPHLEFAARAFPAGFRELVFQSVSSRFDPVLGLQGSPSGENRSRSTTRAICDALFRDPASPAFGRAASKIPVVAFFDYRCPYCRTLAGILADLQSGRDIFLIYKEWPILGQSSVLAAQAALAADRQGKYLAFHARVMNSRLIPTAAYLEEIAGELGMDRTKLREDMNASGTARTIQTTAALASELGLAGTPVLVVGRTIVQGAITRSQLEHLIANESAGGPPDC
jgi:protein-disulfide isomerase